jgi:catechol 2,3-dioxygenase
MGRQAVKVQDKAGAGTSHLIDHIAQVELRVRDLDQSSEFYRDIVGLEVGEKNSDRALLGVPGDPPLLTLSSAGVRQPAERRATGLFHTAFRYPDRIALGLALVRLVEAGLRVGAGDHLVSEALYIDDPDGNGIELYRDRPREEWPPPQPGNLVAMATEPVDLEALLAESHGVEREIPIGGTAIGHVHFQVADVDDTVAFYRDVLGLDLMAQIGSQAAFFASNGYHHHIGANAWNSRGQRPASSESAGLDRAVFTTDRNELNTLKARLEKRDYDFGTEGNQITLKDPSGIELQFKS